MVLDCATGMASRTKCDGAGAGAGAVTARALCVYNMDKGRATSRRMDRDMMMRVGDFLVE